MLNQDSTDCKEAGDPCHLVTFLSPFDVLHLRCQLGELMQGLPPQGSWSLELKVCVPTSFSQRALHYGHSWTSLRQFIITQECHQKLYQPVQLKHTTPAYLVL